VYMYVCRHWGDMQVVRHYFGLPPPKDSVEPYWPAINDGRHGYVPGLHYMPHYSSKAYAHNNGMGVRRSDDMCVVVQI
jgi:hypothetical protein